MYLRGLSVILCNLTEIVTYQYVLPVINLPTVHKTTVHDRLHYTERNEAVFTLCNVA